MSDSPGLAGTPNPMPRPPTDTIAPLVERLRREVDGEVLFDRSTRGRYATDASIYQIDPIGVVVPRNTEAARVAMQAATEAGVPVLPRGAGTSQCGQTVGAAVVIDCSKHVNALVSLDADRCEAVVEPGMVLDHLNAVLKPRGLWFPVDVSTSAQATLGGMTGNNSCGSRSLAYGYMVHRVAAIDAVLPTGERARLDASNASTSAFVRSLATRATALWEREKDEIATRFPRVARRVAGYNLDCLNPNQRNLARLLVGSEGTLAFSERITLELASLPPHKALGVAHFPRFYDAMDAAQHIVKLGPCAVELVDRTMIELARGIASFAPTLNAFVKGEPDAVLLVEFAGADRDEQLAGVRRLSELMGDLGFPGAVVEIQDPAQQRALWEVRKAGLNIMMSMKGDAKPVSFIEDCAVPLEHLAEYTSQLTEVFRRNGTEGTWYAHASVGCLHVRPILNMKGDGALRMRAIAEEAAELVRRYKGAYSGEHGDGLVRSEWIAPFFGPRLTAALAEIKGWFDPRGLMNPGKIVNPPRQDDKTLFRYRPGYQTDVPETVLDWRSWGGISGHVEMCNNNGHCRKFDAGTMCPSYRVTRNEVDVTRGRANTLRLALSGQLGEEGGLGGPAAAAAFDLCVSCKGCRRECPTGVDMARLKVEHLAQKRRRDGLSLRDRLVGGLPHYARWAARLSAFTKAALALPGIKALASRLVGFAPERDWPVFRSQSWLDSQPTGSDKRGKAVVFLADTFNNWFEPENLVAARRFAEAAGFTVAVARAPDGGALCCGRTFLAAGMPDRARQELARVIEALGPWVEQGTPIVGLEPSCLHTLHDELLALHPDDARANAISRVAQTFDSFAAAVLRAGTPMPWAPAVARRFLVHGHCHQKAFGSFDDTLVALRAIPGASVSAVESSCCGMAGAFGYEREHYETSLRMGEAALFPAIRAAGEAVVVAAGTSCRGQIAHGAGREAVHPAVALAEALSA